MSDARSTSGLDCIAFEVFAYSQSRNVYGPLDATPITFGVNVGAAIEEDDKLLHITVRAKLVSDVDEPWEQFLADSDDIRPDDVEEVDLASIGVRSTFKVDNFESYWDGEGIEIPDPMLHEMIAVTYNGMRGAFSAKSAGSPIENYAIPSIEYSELAAKFFKRTEAETE